MDYETQVIKAVDKCIMGNGLQYDIAKAGAIILKHAGFGYVEGGGESGSARGVWKTPNGTIDTKLKEVKNAYKTIVLDAFLSRSIHWNNELLKNTENKFENQLRNVTMTDICIRLNSDAFLKKIINETKNFYC